MAAADRTDCSSLAAASSVAVADNNLAVAGSNHQVVVDNKQVVVVAYIHLAVHH